MRYLPLYWTVESVVDGVITAYNKSVDEHFVGTEEEFLEMFKTIPTGDGTRAQRNSTFPQESQLYGSYSSGYQRVVTRSLRQAITAAAGATLVSTISIPKFSHLIGVTTRVNTTLGTTNGTTGYTVGDGTDADLWGDKTGTAIGTTTDAADYTAVDALGPSMTDRNITITATGGNFDGTGVIEVCAFFLRAEAD